MECNPEDADPARLATYRDAGVTRISLGVQSTVPHVLAGLGVATAPNRPGRPPGPSPGPASPPGTWT